MKNNKEIQSNIASESNAVSYSNSYNKSNSQSYNEWLEAKENLFNTYFFMYVHLSRRIILALEFSQR